MTSADTTYPPEFVAALGTLMKFEGGYAQLDGDSGGPTRFGFSRRQYPDLDVEHLTEDRAMALAFRDWWLRYGFDRMRIDLSISINCSS